MTRELALTGYGVILAEGGRLRSVNATAWHLICDPADVSIQTGDVLAFPYAANPEESAMPDRLRIVRIPREGMASVLTCAYSTGQIGAALEGPADAPAVMGCWAIGDGQSLLDGIAPLLRELCIRHTGAARILNRHTSPHLQGPPDSSLLHEEGAYKPGGMYLPRADASEGYSYLTWPSELDAAFRQIELMLRQLALLAGPAALDISGAGESGSAREALLWQAQARSQKVRRSIEQLLKIALPVVAQAPGASIEIDWPAFNFTGWADRAEAAERLVTSGILSPAEARAQMGIAGP